MATRGATRRKKKTGSKSSSKPPSGIQINKANQGKMRKTAGAKSGQKIPIQRLKKLKNSKDPTTRKRAVFALNVRQGKIGGKKKRKR